MPQGIQVFKADTSILVDTSSFLSRDITYIGDVFANGSVSIPGLTTGTVVLQVNPYSTSVAPVVTSNATHVAWSGTSAFKAQLRVAVV